MALESGQPIKMSQIKAALNSSSNSLRQYNVTAKAATGLSKFDIPDVMSEFWGYTGAAPTTPEVPPNFEPPTPNYVAPTYTPPSPPTPDYVPPSPTPAIETTLTGLRASTDGAENACISTDYGTFSAVIWGTTLCNATRFFIPNVVLQDLGPGTSFFVSGDTDGVRWVKEFRRVLTQDYALPRGTCEQCIVTPTYTPPTPTYVPPTPPITPDYVEPPTYVPPAYIPPATPEYNPPTTPEYVEPPTTPNYTPPPPSYESVFLSPGGTQSDACDSTVGSYGYYLPAGETFTTATQIFSSNTGTQANSGWYSNGAIVKYWDGSQITNTQSCDGAPVEL